MITAGLLPPVAGQDEAEFWRGKVGDVLEEALAHASPEARRAIISGAVCAVLVEFYRCAPAEFDTGELIARWDHMGAAYLAQILQQGMSKRETIQ